MMRGSKDGSITGAKITLNGESLEEAGKFCYLGVRVDVAEFMKAVVSYNMGEGAVTVGAMKRVRVLTARQK